MNADATRNQAFWIEMKLADGPAGCRRMGDPVQLRQVLVNLIQNGIEAMIGITDRPRRIVIRLGKRLGLRMR